MGEADDMTLDEILDDLDDAGNLSDWELGFLDDMLRKREANRDFWMVTLSEKQEAKLRAIWNQRCG